MAVVPDFGLRCVVIGHNLLLVEAVADLPVPSIRGCAHVAPLGLGWVTSSLVHLIDDLYTLRSSGARE